MRIPEMTVVTNRRIRIGLYRKWHIYYDTYFDNFSGSRIRHRLRYAPTRSALLRKLREVDAKNERRRQQRKPR